MGCGLKMVGVLLVIFNVLLFLFGLALVAVGLWSVIDKVYVAGVIGDDLFSAASYLVIITGVILLGVSVVGVCAVRKEQRLFVIVYFVLLLVIFCTLLVTAVLAVVLKSELEDTMVNEMRSSLVSGYGADGEITASWDRLQRELECCGVRAEVGMGSDLETIRQDSWLLYLRTRWYQDARQQNLEPKEYVPRSCCVYDSKINGYIDAGKCQSWSFGPPGNLKLPVNNNALHYDGCYEKAKQLVGEQADILVGCTFAFAFSLIGGLALTVLLYRLLGQQTRVIKQ
ncbi:tetraspanin-11-like [Littorina saxatilis]|uniref:tetraspanin-11-like n=1 Tax=Littorina saxatilis TaxID=31220 RepID=UPI0038B4A244